MNKYKRYMQSSFQNPSSQWILTFVRMTHQLSIINYYHVLRISLPINRSSKPSLPVMANLATNCSKHCDRSICTAEASQEEYHNNRFFNFKA